MKRTFVIISVLAIAFASSVGKADNTIAVKSNLFYDALLTANAGVELQLASKLSLDLSGNYNGWRLSHGRQWKHWRLQPEARRWFKEPMNGHFLAAHLFGGQFNTTLRGARRQGWGAGAGIGYGYAWRFARNWGLEAELAVGYARYSYDKYPCAECGRKIAHRSRDYFGPTKAAVNVVYYFGGTPAPAPVEVVEEVIIPELPAPEPEPEKPVLDFILVDVPHSRVLSEQVSGVARVQFAVNKTDIDYAIGNNADEIGTIITKLDLVRNDLDMQVVAVQLTGYASPEGSWTNNARLAKGRTEALLRYIQNERDLADSIVSRSSVAEDWASLRAAVAASDLPDRDELLRIADSDMKPDAKEAAMRRHRASWVRIVKEMLPPLRRTEYRIDYEHRYEEREARTLEEVNAAISAGDIDRAAMLMVDMPSSPEADYTRGVIAARKGIYGEARAWFERARRRGIKAADNALGQLDALNEK